jgi:perosamine synthetase
VIPVHAPALGEREAAALRDCVERADAGGHSPTVHAFEAEFAARVRSSHAVATSSGSTALHLAFAALGIEPGEEVIVPSFTFAPCADMVALAGASPVLVDSDPATFNITPAAVRAAVTPATRAVLAVHLYGHPCDLTGVAAVCREYGLALVEDCAQGLGATHAGRPVGSFGALACYSFYANKVITTGEGGMVTTDDDALATRLRWLRSHASTADEDHPYARGALGFNYRMPAFSAAVGGAQLSRLDTFLAVKAANAARYTAALRSCPGLLLPADPPAGDTHARWAYTVLVDPETVPGGAGGLAGFLREHGCQTRRFYLPLHQHTYQPGRAHPARLPACERFAPRGLVLPSGNMLQPGEVDQITGLVGAYVSRTA